TVTSTDPVVESAPSDEACANVQDVFPPAAPTRAPVLPREEAIDVPWRPSTEPDRASYRVYRSVAGAPAERLAQVPGTEPSFRGPSPRRGALNSYTVTAVDQAGNESPPSARSDLRVP